MSRQLPLPFPLREQFTIERFEGAANPELIQFITGVDRPRDRFSCIWISGDAGFGKSHLLQAACRVAGSAAYLPAEVGAVLALNLDGYAALPLVAVDDVDRWLGHRAAEESLLHLYNSMWTQRGVLLLAASLSPVACRFALPDLASRLRSAECHELGVLAEAQRVQIFKRLAGERGLELTDDVVDYLIVRVERGLPALLDVLATLDRESLARQRRVTIPFVKEVLGL